MRIMIITSCTGEKATEHSDALSFNDFQRGKKHVADRERDLTKYMHSAEEMYTGQQHIRLMRGIKRCSAIFDIDMFVLSAGYGLIESSRRIAPYNCTFQKMKSAELRTWANTLHVPDDFRKIVSAKYDLGLILLGNEYLEACSFDHTVRFGGNTIVFCSSSMEKKLPRYGYFKVVAMPHSASRNIWLKGEAAARLLVLLSTEKVSISEVMSDPFDIIDRLELETT